MRTGPTVIKLLSILKEILTSNISVREWWSWGNILDLDNTLRLLKVCRDLENSQLPHSRTWIFEMRIFLRILKVLYIEALVSHIFTSVR
jgi:hypothetical protein